MPASKKRVLDAPTPTAPVSKPPVAVGDVVLYAQRIKSPSLDASTTALVPMMVTRTYPADTTVDGVLFTTDPLQCPNGTGTKTIEQVRMGEEEGKWRHR